MASEAALNRLKIEHPEWAPWLAVVACTLRHVETTEWDGAVPPRPGVQQPGTPLLAGATLAVPARLVDRLLRELLRTAARSGTPAMATLERASGRDLDALGLFRASVCQSSAWIAQFADARGADAGALQAVMALVPLSFLHACHRQWAAAMADGWVEGYCPLCGAWPAFAEVRGIERSRYYRCSRCGSAWHARQLLCPYCEVVDHDKLVSLVPEKGSSRGVVEACSQCLGYVKTFTRLQACPPAEVMLEDLASVELDIAALEHGYARAPDAGYALDVNVIDRDAPRSVAAGTS